MIDPITQYILEKQKFFGMSSGPNYERNMQYAVEMYASHYQRGLRECSRKPDEEEYKCYVKITREFNKILTKLAKEKRAECNRIQDPKQRRECNAQVGRVIEGTKADNNRDIQVWRSNY